MEQHYPRWQKETIEKALKTRRAVILSGARQCGKTTLARELSSPDVEYRTLDDLSLKETAESDPNGFVKTRGKTLIIDEIQRVPELLPAIKLFVDEDNRPGQYLITGSANLRLVPAVQESLAGRVKKIRLRPLSQGEQRITAPTFFEKAFSGEFDTSIIQHDRDAILELALRGGYPEAIRLAPEESKEWYLDYIEVLLERDLIDIARIQRIQAMKDVVKVMAAWSGKNIDLTSICSGLSITRPTLETYMNALEAMYLVERAQPWTKTDYDRVGKRSKLYFSDSGLMSSILGWKMDRIKLDSDRSGKLVETFAFGELAALVDVSGNEYQLYHYRDREKREIDFIVEREDGAMLGVEVKAGSTLSKKHFSHLTWFKNNLAGAKPFIGIVLYSGNRLVSFGPGLWGVPFGVLWS